jgi:peptidyl-tRNA hydrolase
VLARFEPEEQAEIDRTILRAADAAELFATDGIEKVMNVFNKLESAPESDAR